MKKLFEKIKNKKLNGLYVIASVLLVAIFLVPKVTNGVIGEGVLAEIGMSAIMTVLKTIAQMVMWICSSFLYIAGLVLDYSVSWTIGGFAQIAGDTGLVGIGWTIFRDLSNIVFIFLVLWIAISTILGLSHDAPMGSILKIAVAAILVNFSLFITKAVIDVSNIVALHFYNLIVTKGPDGPSSFAGVFMQGMYLNTIYDAKGVDWKSVALDFKMVLIFAFGSVAMLIAAWSFLAAAVMFLIRSLYLVILMIFSPFAFIAWILPGHSLGHLTHEWWDKLFKQAFFAPIFLIIIYVVGKALATQGSMGVFGVDVSGKSLTSLVDGIVDSKTADTGVVGVVFNFFMIIGMIIAALMSSNKLGAVGASTAISWGNHIRNAGQSWVGGRTIGMGARWLDERLEKTYLGNTGIGKTLRNWTTVSLKDAKFGGHMSAEERHKEDLELESRQKEASEISGESVFGDKHNATDLLASIKKAEVDGAKEISTAKSALEKVKKGGDETEIKKAEENYEKIKRGVADKLEENRAKLQQILVKITPHAFAEMVPKHLLFDKEFMRNVSRGQLMSVLNSDHFAESEKIKVREARYGLIKDASDKVKQKNEGYEEEYKQYTDFSEIFTTGDEKIRDEKIVDTLNKLKLAEGSEERSKTEEDLRAAIDLHKQGVNEKDAQKQKDAIEQGLEVAKMKIPVKKMIADVAPDVRAWMRAMADQEVDEMYRYNPNMVTDPDVAMTLRSSVTRYMRQSESVASIDKDKMRDSKFRDMIDAEDLINGFGEIAPAFKTFQHMISKLVEFGGTEAKKVANMTESEYTAYQRNPEEWENLKEDVLRKAVKEVAFKKGKYQEYQRSFNGEQAAMEIMGAEKMTDAIAGKSSDEFPILRGSRWRNPAFAKYMTRGMAQEFRQKDTGDLKEVMDMFLFDLRNYIERGVPMSRENIDTLHWVVTESSGKTFKNRTVINPELQETFDRMEVIFSELGRNTEISNETLARALKTVQENGWKSTKKPSK